MNKIYGIFTGKYSDWDVKGFFTNEKDAERYCAVKNADPEKYSKKHYIIELDKMNVDFKDVKLYDQYTVWFDNFENGVINAKFNCCEKHQYTTEMLNEKIHYNNWGATAYFEINTDSKEKAIKIACDRFAEFKHYYTECEDLKKAFILLSESLNIEIEFNEHWGIDRK